MSLAGSLALQSCWQGTCHYEDGPWHPAPILSDVANQVKSGNRGSAPARDVAAELGWGVPVPPLVPAAGRPDLQLGLGAGSDASAPTFSLAVRVGEVAPERVAHVPPALRGEPLSPSS